MEELVLEKKAGIFSLAVLEHYGAKAFFTAKPFDLSFENPQRENLLKELGVNSQELVCPSQVHGRHVAAVGKKHGGSGAFGRQGAIQATDALITKEKGLWISVMTADCLPVFVLDRKTRAAAIIHAGWKGLFQNIISGSLASMNRIFGSSPSDLICCLGPCIRSCCYEVKEDLLSCFPRFIEKREGSFFMDMPSRAADELEGAGVRKDRVFDSMLCTCCLPEDFHSFRREGGAAGRNMSLLSVCF